MKANADLPLVTIQMSTYNQEKYVRESVRGVLAQTYEPLQIVISDDHSTDSTWEIIQEEVNAYRQKGGVHKDIVLNRNSENLGIIRHFQFLTTLCKGVLFVCNAGDDISLPNRVERIVNAWIDSGRKATWIFHGGRKISPGGVDLGDLSVYGKWRPLGAASVYVGVEHGRFPPITKRGCYEDWIFSRRAMMCGPVVELKDELIKYRYGDGISTSVNNFRVNSGRVARSMLLTCDQMRVDVESQRSVISKELLDMIQSKNEAVLQEFVLRDSLFNGQMLSARWKGFRGLCPSKPFLSIGRCLKAATFFCCLLPPGCCDWLPNLMARIGFAASVVKYKCIRVLK